MSDSISRQDAIELAKKVNGNMTWADRDELIKQLKALPSTEKTGHWMEITTRVDGYGAIYYQHDCCCELYKSPYKFCPNCGARMVGDEK